jgi:hypothetical protein
MNDANGAPAPPNGEAPPQLVTVAPGPNAIDPRDRLREVMSIRPPRSKPARRDRTIADESTAYHLIRWRPEFKAGFKLRDKRYTVAGDHLYVAELNGFSPVYVRLGPSTNPFIRLRRQMTLRRSFSQLTLRFSDPLGFGAGDLANIYPDVTLYASTGPFVDVNDVVGVDASLIARSDLSASTTPIYLHTMFGTGQNLTTGCYGGVVVIENTDGANDLYLGGGAGSQSSVNTAGFKIPPGATLTLQLAGRMGTTDIATGAAVGLRVFTLAGTATFSILISPYETDTGDHVFGLHPAEVSS